MAVFVGGGTKAIRRLDRLLDIEGIAGIIPYLASFLHFGMIFETPPTKDSARTRTKRHASILYCASGEIAAHGAQGAFFKPAHLGLGDANLGCHFHLGAPLKNGGG